MTPPKERPFLGLCAASGGLEAKILGGEVITSYQGAKRYYRRGLVDVMGVDLALVPRLEVAEASPWFNVWEAVRVHGWDAVVEAVRGLVASMPNDDGPKDKARYLWLRDQYMPKRAGKRREWQVWNGTPETAAAYLWLSQRSYGGRGPAAGFIARPIPLPPGKEKHERGNFRHKPDAPLNRMRAHPWKDWQKLDAVHRDARRVRPRPGWTVYIDPAYKGTTGYRYGSFDRKAVVQCAVKHAMAGSSVFVSEAQPIPELISRPGWESAEIFRNSHKGRNHSRTKTEFLTFFRA